MRGALAAAFTFRVAPAPAPATAETVKMPGRHFDPARLTVVAGDTVGWRNDDAEQHTVAAAAGGAFASPILATRGQLAHRFDTPGSHAYVCTLHPFMRGWLRGDVRRRARLVLYDRAGAVIATSRTLRPWTIRGTDADGELIRAHGPE
jgi:plastocyanin